MDPYMLVKHLYFLFETLFTILEIIPDSQDGAKTI